jgi:hypothetical protein
MMWVSIGLLVFGIIILGGAAALIYFVGGREPRDRATPATQGARPDAQAGT